MLPKIIIHNSLSLDGSLSGFEPNMALHYQLAGQYHPDAHMIGSNTIKAGIELYGDGVPIEEPSDFKRPKRENHLPLWVIIDSKGSLHGVLHTCRRFDMCRDIVLLVSETTPREYIEYLTERSYRYHVVGRNHVDLEKACGLLVKQYEVHTVLTDTGRILSTLLLNLGLVHEISLLIHPIIIGNSAYSLFSALDTPLPMTLKKTETFNHGYIWLVYDVTG